MRFCCIIKMKIAHISFAIDCWAVFEASSSEISHSASQYKIYASKHISSNCTQYLVFNYKGFSERKAVQKVYLNQQSWNHI